MTKEDEMLEYILTDFPDKRKEITTLLDQSSNFIEICEDYALCKKSITCFELKKDVALIHQIRNLKLALKTLKKELLSALNK